MRPVILVTADRRVPKGMHDSPRVRPRRAEAWVLEAYTRAVRQAGGVPLLLPPGDSDPAEALERVDGVVLTGGHFDIHPRWYGEAVSGRLDRVEDLRTEAELTLARLSIESDMPVLGICGGMQALCVANGGTLIQDLPSGREPGAVIHEQPTDPAEPWHEVRMDRLLLPLLGQDLRTNSTHHQAVRNAGREFVPCGWAHDDVIEAMVIPKHRFAVGVQWHPELLGDVRLYEALVESARDGRGP